MVRGVRAWKEGAWGPAPLRYMRVMSRSLVSGRKISADDEAHRRDDDRVPQTGVDVSGRRHDREHGRRQEAAEPAVADVIGQRQPAVADAGREQLDQPGGDRRRTPW